MEPSSDIRFEVEFPPPGFKSADRTINIRGWCFHHGGQNLRALRARIRGEKISATRKQPRFELAAAFPDAFEQAMFSGFHVDVPLSTGRNHIVLECQTPDRTWHPMTTLEITVPKFRIPWRKPAADPAPGGSYPEWISKYDMLDSAARERLAAEAGGWPHAPLISVIVPVYETPEPLLRACIESVRNQVYPHWELCVADDASTAAHVGEVLDGYQALDPRIKVVKRNVRGHICAASNSALELATGSHIALLDHDDEISVDALFQVARMLQEHPDAGYIYSDEDKLDAEGIRVDPYFKPSWSPDMLKEVNYCSHLSVYRRGLIEEAGGFRPGMEGCQDWDLLLRVVEREPEIHHIPRILYHWRQTPGSTALGAGKKSYIQEAAEKTLRAHLHRTGRENDEARWHPGGWMEYRPAIPDPPPEVTIIVPTKNRRDLLERCVTSILEKTNYPAFKIRIIDHESDDPDTQSYLESIGAQENVCVQRYSGEFNYSKMNNKAVQACSSGVVALLNNDMEVIGGDWLERLVAHAIRPGIGAVGAMLFYPSGAIQHAGVFLGHRGAAGHFYRGTLPGTASMGNRLNVTQNVSAVTGACLVIEREKYLSVGGMDEEFFKVTLNDVDLCLKLGQAGLRTLLCPYAVLYHHESASRKPEDRSKNTTERSRSEILAFASEWSAAVADDPFYNPNLSLEEESCRLAFPPRTGL